MSQLTNIRKDLIVPSQNVVYLKRLIPKHHKIKEKINIDIPFSEMITQSYPILHKNPRYWPENLKKKMAYYHISINQFNRFIKNETHITWYELMAIAEILDLKLSLTIISKKSA